MREILFRAKTLDGGGTDGWAFGNLIVCGSGAAYFISSGKIFVDCSVKCGKVCFSIAQVKPETVGQWTGFTDVNGVDIYEGDIIRFYDDTDGSEDGIVFWDEEHSGFSVRWKIGDVNPLDFIDGERSEVVGNKWDGVS